jgi:hypothetical protein
MTKSAYHLTVNGDNDKHLPHVIEFSSSYSSLSQQPTATIIFILWSSAITEKIPHFEIDFTTKDYMNGLQLYDILSGSF